MPSPPKSIKRPISRPQKEIDWRVVDEYLEAGCTGTEIAGRLGTCADTLYNRCEREKGVTFSAYSQEKKSSGEALLRKIQYDKAIGKTDQGDNTLLIWLGKTRLEQKETTEISVHPETIKTFDKIMGQIEEMQKNSSECPPDIKKF